MRELALVREDDAEAGCHRVFKKYNLVPPVAIERVDLLPGVKKFPIIRVTTWVQHLLDAGRLPSQLTGTASFDKMKLVLKEYWQRFKQIRNDYYLFNLAEAGIVSLDSCVPIYSHTDEGRSYKHLGVWVLSVHGVLGRGTAAYLQSGAHRLPISQNEMGMNFLGKTWSTQFIVACMIKTLYTKFPQAQDEVIKLFAADLKKLLYEGVQSKDGKFKVHLVHIGTKGDLPALVRLGTFQRSYSHVPKGASSRKACEGVCHLCLAGVERGPGQPVAVPFEDMSPQAAWVGTLHSKVAWENTPTILQGLPLTQSQSIEFFSPTFGIIATWV